VPRIRRRLAPLVALTLVASIVAGSSPAGAAWLFKDGFEGGNLSKWTSSQNVAVVSGGGVAHSGKKAARAIASSSSAWATKNLAATQVELYARIRFKIQSQSTESAVLSLRTTGGAELLTAGRTTAGLLYLRNGVTSTQTVSNRSVSLDAWHELLIHVRVDDDTSRWEVWLDHDSVDQLSDLGELGTTPIGQYQIGDSRSGRTFQTVFDDAAFDRRVIDDTDPSVPTGFALDSLTAAAVTLRWDLGPAIDEVDRYTVFRDGQFLTAANDFESTFTDLDVSPGDTHSYRIDAVDDSGNASAQTNAVVVTVPNADTIEPTVPTGLAVDVPVADQISLVWNPNPSADEVVAYHVFRDGSQVGTVTGADLFFIDTGLAPSTTYGYQVRAEDAAGLLSAKTAAVHGVTTASNPPAVWWGVATHKEGSLSDQAVRRNLEDDIGRGFSTFRKYANWTQNIPSKAQRDYWNDEGIMPFTAWTTYVKGAGDLTYADIASGARDTEIRAQARRIRDSGIPMFFTFQHEPEDGQGSTDPQAGPPQDYIAAFIRIHDIFEEEEVDNLTWVNTLTLASFKRSKGKSAEAWSPPPQYYDYVGVDGYVRWPCVQWDGRPFFSFRDTFVESYEFAESLGKPLFIGEIGIIEQTECNHPEGDTQAKARWFREARRQTKAWPLLIGIAWTHATVNFLDRFPLDYHVDTTPQAMEAFIEAGNDPYFGRFGPP
jgi:hypothetical protein